jgi:sugar phosphate isomerase/epimerase
VSRIALQLYTVRDACADDLAGALATTAGCGFEGVEVYDLCGHSADTVRELLDENGLVACGRHAGLPLVESELEGLASELRILGTDRLIVSWVEPPGTAAEADAIRNRLVTAAERAAALGLRLGFHNHDGELVALEDGRTLLDRLLDAPKALLFLELDLGWVWYAGREPLDLLERLGERAPLVHVKDMRRDGEPVHVPLGGGDIDYLRLGEVAEQAGVEWLIVEQDETEGAAFEAVGVSIAALQQLLEVSS